MPEIETAMTVARRAQLAYRNERRFSAVVQAIVSQTMLENDKRLDRLEEDPHDLRRAVYEMSLSVAALLLQTVYEEDAEIKYWKALAEKMVDLRSEVLSLSPMPAISKLAAGGEG